MERLLRVVLGAALAVACWVWLGTSPVLADGGPHVAAENSGASTLTSDTCAGCHRAHTAKGQYLLAAATEVALCLMCHGASGTGATTNVIDGVVAGTSHGLRGGGFTNAIMDTAWNGAAASRPATSAHTMDGTTLVTMWGNGAIGSGPGTASVTLTCTDCHDPHGNGSYRILRPIPSGSGATVGIQVPEQTTRAYAVASAQNRYFGEVYGNSYWDVPSMYALDEWCASCHTRHDAYDQTAWTPGPARTNTGDPVYAYRHMTRYDDWDWNACSKCHEGRLGTGHADNPFGIPGPVAMEPTCETCHVAHGSAAQMGTFSGAVPWPDGTTTPSGSGRSSLLRLDNRGVCVGCHNPTK